MAGILTEDIGAAVSVGRNMRYTAKVLPYREEQAMEYNFPKDFIWGVSTSAAQVEGAAFEDGRGPSIWDVFAAMPGRIAGGATPAVACDQYHLYREDVQRMKALGIRSYRFSFSWSRILPEGIGKVNKKGIAYYRDLISCLKENDILPNATMYHWDLPYALQLMGGFGNREVVKWFLEYANVLLDNFGNDVYFWATFNEPIATYVGLAKGFFAPGLCNEKYAREAIHNLLLCHGETVRLFRAKHLQSKIGIVVDIWHHQPAREDDPNDREIAAFHNKIEGYDVFLHPLFLGGYSDELTAYLRAHSCMPNIESGDFETIRQPLDFYGLNFYNGLFDHAQEQQRDQQRKKQKQQTGGNYQDKPQYHPEVLLDVLRMLRDVYHVNVPIYLTENGVEQKDDQQHDQAYYLNDQNRIDYIKDVLKFLHAAMEEGIDVRGYYHWSLLDNFEWSAGYQSRYGLYYTDFRTLERIPKKSAEWYQTMIRQNGFEA